MAKHHFIIPLLALAALSTACDDPTETTYTFQSLTGSGTTPTSDSFLGTYKVTGGTKDLFDGEPFAISFWATDATSASGSLVRITPLGSTGVVDDDEHPYKMYEGTYTASSDSATLKFTQDGMNYSQTGTASFLNEKQTDDRSIQFFFDATDEAHDFTAIKIDDYVMQIDDYYGTATFLANANENYVEGASWQFCDESGNGFYFPNGAQVLINNATTFSGATLDGTYDYSIKGYKIPVWNQGALKYEDDSVTTFCYFITMPSGGGGSSAHNLWVDGKCYNQVTRT